MKRKEGNNSLRYAFYFIALMLFFGAISLLFKIGEVIKNSSFDSTHSYNLHFKGNDSECVIAFSPDSKKISIARVIGKIPESIQKDLNIPVDSRVDKNCPEKNSLFSGILGLLTNSSRVDSKPTILDVLKLSLFIRSVPSEFITEEEIKTVESELTKQNKLSPLFLDKSIVDERKTIQIINSTDTSRLGARLAVLLNNIGANIVLVVTSEKPQEKSQIIYYGEESYTLKRMGSILNFEKDKKEGENIADLIIIIGEDQSNTFKF